MPSVIDKTSDRASFVGFNRRNGTSVRIRRPHRKLSRQAGDTEEEFRRYRLKGKRYLGYVDKYYPTDIGLRHGLFGYRDSDIVGLLEAVVYLELSRRGYTVSVGVLGDADIDFVAERTAGPHSSRLRRLTCSPTVRLGDPNR